MGLPPCNCASRTLVADSPAMEAWLMVAEEAFLLT